MHRDGDHGGRGTVLRKSRIAPGRRVRRWSSHTLLASALVAIAVSSCAGEPADPATVATASGDVRWTAPPEPGDVSTGPDGVEAPADAAGRYGPSPLSAYTVVGEDVTTLMSAVDVLVEECMAERGFTYEPDYQLSTGSEEGETAWSGFLGLVDADRAASTGYGVSSATAAAAAELEEALDEALAERSSLTPERIAYLTALYGPADVAIRQGQNPEQTDADENSCMTVSTEALTPDVAPPDASIQGTLGEEARAVAQADPAVTTALSGWTTCMADQGYVLDAIPVPNLPADEVTPATIDQAVADVACKESTGLIDAYITTLYSAEEDLIQQNLPDLDAFAAFTSERLRLASEVLAGER